MTDPGQHPDYDFRDSDQQPDSYADAIAAQHPQEYEPELLAAQLIPELGGLRMPLYGGDCGLDLVTSEDATLKMGETANIPCGVAVALPQGTFGWVTARSGTWVRHGVLVVPGIIDEGWRGELRTMVYKPYLFHRQDGIPMVSKLPAGTRLAQLIVLPNLLPGLTVTYVDREQLPPAERGLRGFGSTG